MGIDSGVDQHSVKNYYDAHAGKWNAQREINYYIDFVNNLKTYLQPDASILEIGMGGGRDATVLLGEGYKYIGTDFSSGQLADAKSRLVKSGFEEKPLSQQDAFHLAFPSHSFDAFWGAAVLHHWPKDKAEKILHEMKRVVKPGGYGFLSIREGDEPFYDEEKKMTYYRWKKEEFEEVLKANKFEVINFDKVITGPKPLDGTEADINLPQYPYLLYLVKST